MRSSKARLVFLAVFILAVWVATCPPAQATLVAEVTDVDGYTCTIAEPQLCDPNYNRFGDVYGFGEVWMERGEKREPINLAKLRSLQFELPKCWLETKGGEKIEAELWLAFGDEFLRGQFLLGSLRCQYEISLMSVKRVEVHDTTLPSPPKPAKRETVCILMARSGDELKVSNPRAYHRDSEWTRFYGATKLPYEGPWLPTGNWRVAKLVESNALWFTAGKGAFAVPLDGRIVEAIDTSAREISLVGGEAVSLPGPVHPGKTVVVAGDAAWGRCAVRPGELAAIAFARREGQPGLGLRPTPVLAVTTTSSRRVALKQPRAHVAFPTIDWYSPCHDVAFRVALKRYKEGEKPIAPIDFLFEGQGRRAYQRLERSQDFEESVLPLLYGPFACAIPFSIIAELATSGDGSAAITLTDGANIEGGVYGGLYEIRGLRGDGRAVPFSWDPRNLRKLRGHLCGVNSVCFSPDGKLLASGSLARKDGFLTDIKGKTLFVPGLASPSTVKLWDVASGAELLSLKGHSGHIMSVAFSPDGKLLATGSADQTIKLWRVPTGREVRTLKGHRGPVNSVAFSPDGKLLASGSADKTVRMWEVSTGLGVQTLIGHEGGVNSVTFSPDGRLLASASADETVRTWDVATGQEAKACKRHNGSVTSVAFSPDGGLLACGSPQRTVTLWYVAAGMEARALEIEGLPEEVPPELLQDWVVSVALSAHGALLASGCGDGSVTLWNVSSLVHTEAG